MNITAKTIHVMGDIHGEVEMVNEYIENNHPDVLILLGDCALFWAKRTVKGFNDFGSLVYETNISTRAFDTLYPDTTKIFWIKGNHEPFNYIEEQWGRLGNEPIEIKENVFYCPIGSILTINEKNCLFVGGALSIDADFRVAGVDWFEQEILNDVDLDFVLRSIETKKIDMIFSHTCPHGFDIKAHHDLYDLKFNENSRFVLKEIADIARPTYWFFGHWHVFKGGTTDNIIWQGLNTISPGLEHGGRSVLDISHIFE